MEKGKEILYLTQKDVEEVNLGMGEIIDILEEAFIEKSHKRIEMPPKPGIHTANNSFIHAMPCWIPKLNSAGIKWVGGYPDNQSKGLPYITGLLILNCPETGVPLAIMDCVWITAMRTGAASGLSARHFANPNSEVLGVLGCGVQGKTNLEAILVECKNIKKVYAYDLYPEVAEAYAKECSEKFNIEIIPVKDPKEAVVDSDVLVTAGPIVLNEEIGVIEKEWLKEGVTITPVDFDCLFKPKQLDEAVDKYYTDGIGQYSKFKSMGYFPNGPENPPEICDVITEKIEGRTNKSEKIVTMNIGMALDDMATAIRIYERALEKGIGTKLPL